MNKIPKTPNKAIIATVLRILANSREPLSVPELAEASGYELSTIYVYTNLLRSKGKIAFVMRPRSKAAKHHGRGSRCFYLPTASAITAPPVETAPPPVLQICASKKAVDCPPPQTKVDKATDWVRLAHDALDAAADYIHDLEKENADLRDRLETIRSTFMRLGA